MYPPFPGDDTPYSIDVYDNLLYVTTYRNHSLLTLSKLGPSNAPEADNNATYLATGLQRIGDLVVVQQYKQDTTGLNRKAQSTLDVRARKFERNSFDVAWISSVNTPIHINRSHLLALHVFLQIFARRI